MDEREENLLPAEERKRERMLRRKKELRIARIKFGVGCGLILLLIILLIIGCSKGCKREPKETEAPTDTTAATMPTVVPTDPAPSFAYSSDDWQLLLVDASNPMPQDYSADLTTLRTGAKINSLCYPDLQKMFDDCRANGLKPSVYSAYLTETDQQKLFETRVSELMSQSFKQEQAETEALKSVSKPGFSEYQTGLALDIVEEGLTNKDTDKLTDCEVLKWMRENSWKYGFVERYTQEQATQKGLTYQPCHYRYVGIDAAKDIHEMNICLEDLIALIP